MAQHLKFDRDTRARIQNAKTPTYVLEFVPTKQAYFLSLLYSHLKSAIQWFVGIVVTACWYLPAFLMETLLFQRLPSLRMSLVTTLPPSLSETVQL